MSSSWSAVSVCVTGTTQLTHTSAIIHTHTQASDIGPTHDNIATRSTQTTLNLSWHPLTKVKRTFPFYLYPVHWKKTLLSTAYQWCGIFSLTESILLPSITWLKLHHFQKEWFLLVQRCKFSHCSHRKTTHDHPHLCTACTVKSYNQ